MRALAMATATSLLVACFSGYSDQAGKRDLRVRRGNFIDDIVLTGELDAARGAAITVPELPDWQTSIKWMATEGDEVKEGDRVVELDNTTFATSLDTKRQNELQALQELQQRQSEWKADLEQKQLDFEKRRSEYEKAQLDAAVPRDILSAREYEERQTKLSRARVELEKAKDLLGSQKLGIDADRKNLQLRLQKAQREIQRSERAIASLVLRAPRAGVVVIREIPWEGRKLQVGDTVWVGFPLALIPELSSLQVNVALPDVDDGRVHEGMRATITLDGYPNMTFTGQVKNISAVAQESARQSLRRAFKAVVSLDRIDPARMRPGLSARVVIRRAARGNALLAPRAALDLDGTPPPSAVHAAGGSGAPRARLANGKFVPVKLGACNAQECVVVSGLEEGQHLGRADQESNG